MDIVRGYFQLFANVVALFVRLLDLFRELFVLKSETLDCLCVLMHQSLKCKSMLFFHVSNRDT